MSAADDVETAAEEVVLKIVVCGDGSSGKTCLCERFVKDTFERSYHQTLGLDFFSKRISLPGDVQVLMQVWDIGGQSIAGEMIDKYIYGSHAALVVYDVTNMSSFDNTQDWLNVIRRVTKSQEKQINRKSVLFFEFLVDMRLIFMETTVPPLTTTFKNELLTFGECYDAQRDARRLCVSCCFAVPPRPARDRRRRSLEQLKVTPPQIVLVGNKVDEERLRKVPVDSHCAFAKQHDLKAFYVSAKTGDSVAMMFRQVAADVLRIVLTRVEQEADIAIVQGEVTHDVKEPRRRHIDQSRNTAVCSIQ
ncbi:hypothetical protein Q1695_005837 [Nippostrongylus brasiliensis]|nr:hypothetical protein Q1695_005837 [Nippostrongylus brasiliensis]